jgi:hypothetical protein
MVKSKVPVAKYLEQQIAMCGRSQKDIASDIGYANPNVITMFKTGATKVPLQKVPALAKALGVDPKFMMRLVLAEYMPETYEALESTLGEGSFVSDDELALVRFIRSATKNAPIDLSIAENKTILTDTLKALSARDYAKAEAALTNYKAAPPNKRSQIGA